MTFEHIMMMIGAIRAACEFVQFTRKQMRRVKHGR